MPKRSFLAFLAALRPTKTPLLVRALVKAGAEVQVVMTPSSKSFVAPLSLSTVSTEQFIQGFVESERSCGTTMSIWVFGLT